MNEKENSNPVMRINVQRSDSRQSIQSETSVLRTVRQLNRKSIQEKELIDNIDYQSEHSMNHSDSFFFRQGQIESPSFQEDFENMPDDMKFNLYSKSASATQKIQKK